MVHACPDNTFCAVKCQCAQGCAFDVINANAALRKAYYMDEATPALLCIYPRKRSATTVPNFGTESAFSGVDNNFTTASSEDLCSKANGVGQGRLGIRLYREPTNDLTYRCKLKCLECRTTGNNCNCS